MNQDLRIDSTQSVIECSKLTIQTLEEGVKYVQSWQHYSLLLSLNIFNFLF